MLYSSISIFSGIVLLNVHDQMAIKAGRFLSYLLAIASFGLAYLFFTTETTNEQLCLNYFQLFISFFITWAVFATWDHREGKSILGLSLIALGLQTALIMSDSTFATVLSWSLLPLPMIFEVFKREKIKSFVLIYQILGIAAFILWAFWFQGSVSGMLIILLAITIRQAEFPFHSWLIAIRNPLSLPLVAQFIMFNSGAIIYLKMRSPDLVNHSTTLTTLAICSGLYLAALAWRSKRLIQKGVLIVFSQASLILAGMEFLNFHALSGALVYWLSHSIAGIIFLMLLKTIVVRKGILSADQFYGLGHKQNIHASSFLISGLALIGTPLTLGFVGEDILFHTFLETYPFLGFMLIVLTALNGFNVLKLYSHIFLGPELKQWTPFALRRNELFVLISAIFILVLLGVMPRIITDKLNNLSFKSIEVVSDDFK